MPNLIHANNSQPFTVSEIFKVPGLDIYEQMVCFVLNHFINEGGTAVPAVSEIAAKGRMTSQEATSALQNLVDRKIIPLKVFREIVGEYGDSRLSWAAKGLLVFLKNHEGITLDELAELSKDHRDSLLTELRELYTLGYLEDSTLIEELG
ncbi:MAG: hypothetical protein K0S39_3902 [Paenibacillus sp.]|nr:hypothetical protein [Paenibacillus sp.]